MNEPWPTSRPVRTLDGPDSQIHSVSDRPGGFDIIVGPAPAIVRALQATIRRFPDYERLYRATLGRGALFRLKISEAWSRSFASLPAPRE